MECSRCGGEAVVKRDNAVYCGKCALARDWEEVIHVVQSDRITLEPRPPSGSPASRPDTIPMDGTATSKEAEPPAPKAQPAPAAAPPADPFG